MGRFRDAFPILEVSDVAQSLRFYTEILGFEMTYSFPAEGDPEFAYMELKGGGKLGIAGPKDAVETGSIALWFYVDDVDAAVDEVRAAGVSVVSEPADMEWGERVASVADPDGYTVHIGTAAA